MQRCLKNLASGVVERVAAGFGKAGSEAVDFWEEKSYSVGSQWIYIFNRQKSKKEIPVKKGAIAMRSRIWMHSILACAACSAVFTAGLVCAVAQGTSASQGAAAALPTVGQVLDKYVSALGGEAAIRRITTRVAKGTLKFSQPPAEATTEVYQKAPNKIYMDTEFAGRGSIKRGFDGKEGWHETPQAGVEDLTGAELAGVKRAADFYGDINLKKLYPKMTVKGEESVDGRKAYVIDAVSRDGSPETWYFDAESGLKVRNISHTEGPNGPEQQDTTLGDYRAVDGVEFPFMLRETFGDVTLTIKFTDVRQNVPISDAIFAKPVQ